MHQPCKVVYIKGTASRETEMTTTTTSYTKLRNGNWGIKGHGLRAGQAAVVYKRSGERTTVMVDKVLWTGPDGLAIASIRTERAATRTSSNWSVRRQHVGGHCQMCGCQSWDCAC